MNKEEYAQYRKDKREAAMEKNGMTAKKTGGGHAMRYIKAARYCRGRFGGATGDILMELAMSTDYDEGFAIPSYEYLMLMGDHGSKGTVAKALKEIEKAGVLEKQRRWQTSTKYFLNLEKMLELRIVYMNKHKRGVVERVNNLTVKFCAEPLVPRPKHEAPLPITELRDEGVMFDVLDYVAKIYETKFEELNDLPKLLFPDYLRDAIFDEREEGFATYKTWFDFFLYVYPEARRAYFISKMKDKIPPLDWPEGCTDDAKSFKAAFPRLWGMSASEESEDDDAEPEESDNELEPPELEKSLVPKNFEHLTAPNALRKAV